MTEFTCDNCDTTVPDGEHWVHFSVFHHDRNGNPNKYSKDDPENHAVSYCPECAEETGLV